MSSQKKEHLDQWFLTEFSILQSENPILVSKILLMLMSESLRLLSRILSPDYLAPDLFQHASGHSTTMSTDEAEASSGFERRSFPPMAA